MQASAAAHRSSNSTAPVKLDKFFVPARSSRHRIAVIALYRALIALASSVPLPPDLTKAWNETRSPRRQTKTPTNHPLVDIVRRTFRRNRADTSPRIVAPALHAGYRSLELLKDAGGGEGTTAASHDQVIALVRQKLAERQRSHAARRAWLERQPPRPAPSRGSGQPGTPHDRQDQLPLLVRISPDPTPENPFPAIEYATPNHPRPLSELGGSGRRHVPHIDMANDFPILRRRKPQPEQFSHVLRRKMDKRVTRMTLYKEMQELDVPDARLEDEWEDLVREAVEDELLREENVARGNRGIRYTTATAGDGSGAAAQDHEQHDQQRLGMHTASPASITPTSESLSRLLLDLLDDPTTLASPPSIFPPTDRYAATAQYYGKTYLERMMTRETEDALARSAALRELVLAERQLAVAEKAERDAARRRAWEARMAAEHGEKEWRGVVERETRQRDEARARRIEEARQAALRGSDGVARVDGGGEGGVVVTRAMWRRHVPRVYREDGAEVVKAPPRKAPSGEQNVSKREHGGKREQRQGGGGGGGGGKRGSSKEGDGGAGARQPRRDGDKQHQQRSGGLGGSRHPIDQKLRRAGGHGARPSPVGIASF
ncbi:hypothetical protein Micbo1qcDRAFT_166468 [Microdochium bolleyi]|uniref:Uncharacterized protein n=1 Tax=Microdochium bolleyi TaxID=196109 RepID=A0A136IU24_9PEZI|nr:hypothetical protein Micbo1qcDRAFT_166468 [Microdochium bolleyi]